MKKIFRTLAIVAAAALGLTACENDINEQVNGNEGEKVTVEVVAGVSTRSAFGEKVDGVYTSTWSKDQVVYFAPYQPAEGNIPMSEATVAEKGATASFEVEFTNTQNEGAIHAFSPKGVQNGAGGFTSNKVYFSETPYIYLNVPAAQTTSATSCDEQVHVLYASKEYTGGFPTSVSMDFNHVLAYGKMNITNFEGEIAQVAVTFPEAVAGGSVKYYYLTNTFDGASAKTLTITNVENNTAIWFGIVPTESGEEKMSGDMTVVVTDGEGKTYTKELATDGKLAFLQGQVSNFTVNMSGVVAEQDKDYCGNYNIVAKRSSGNFYYMTSNLGTASTKRFQIVDTGAAKIGDVAENEQYVWVVEKSGDNYKIKTTEGKYITWSTGNSANLDNTGKALNITANGEAVNINLVEDTSRILQLNNTSGDNYFAFYTSAQIKDLYLIPYTGVVKKASSLKFTTTAPKVDLYNLDLENYDYAEPSFDLTPKGATLAWNSDDTDVATVDKKTGVVTIVGNEGSAIITATFAGNDEYSGCSASYTIVVEDNTPSGTTWKKATSVTVGKQYLLVCGSKNMYMTSIDTSKKYGVGTQISITNNNTITVDVEDSAILTLEAGSTNGTYSFKMGSSYLYWSSSNSLTTNATKSANSSWKITFDANGNATILNGKDNTRKLQWNASSPRFACYTSSQTAVQLYEKQ